MRCITLCVYWLGVSNVSGVNGLVLSTSKWTVVHSYWKIFVSKFLRAHIVCKMMQCLNSRILSKRAFDLQQQCSEDLGACSCVQINANVSLDFFSRHVRMRTYIHTQRSIMLVENRPQQCCLYAQCRDNTSLVLHLNMTDCWRWIRIWRLTAYGECECQRMMC